MLNVSRYTLFPPLSITLCRGGLEGLARQLCALTPRARIATRYGSGSGLARAHSSPMMRGRKKSKLGWPAMVPMEESISSAFARGAFVTAAQGTPAAASCAQNSRLPPATLFHTDASKAEEHLLLEVYSCLSEDFHILPRSSTYLFHRIV